MDAIELLTNDHNKVRELFKKFNGGGGLTGLVRRTVGTVDPRERRSSLAQICQELTVHTRIEEDIFYPAVRALGDGELNAQLAEALSEHGKVKEEVRRLRGKDGTEDGLDSQVGQLEQDVEHHAGEEEREMFPRLEELMPEDQRVALGKQLQAAKRGTKASVTGQAPAAKARATSKPKRRATRKAASAPRGRSRSTAAGRKRAPGAKRVTGRKRAKTKARSSKATKGRRQKKARAGRR
jgi:hemerythrin superfamily protein